MAVAALVLGIIGASLDVVCCWYPVVGQFPSIVLGILAIIFGVLGKKKQPEKEKQAQAGLILGIVTLALAVVIMIIGVIVLVVFIKEYGSGGFFPNYSNYCR